MPETLADWKITRRDVKPFQSIEIIAPNGYSAIVSSHDRNPELVLYMLARAILEERERAVDPLTTGSV